MRVVVMGAGISGHTAALYLRRLLSSKHEVHVVSPKTKWNWIPSNIWVGVGEMSEEQVSFELPPIYQKQGINFTQGNGIAIYPEGDVTHSSPYIKIQHTDQSNLNNESILEYDFLINATGPKLNFEATPGLGPDHHSLSVCTADHAIYASQKLQEIIQDLKKGQHRTLVIGMGHGLCTCEGAAFEYVFNVDHLLRENGVRENAKLIFITNEKEVGDFGVGGMWLKTPEFITSGKLFAESLFEERGIEAICGAHVKLVVNKKLSYEQLDGTFHDLEFDFAMLLPPFTGVHFKAFKSDGSEITDTLFSANRFMKVDANYLAKGFDEWLAEDWPKTYQTSYSNIFAIGIAFAPPHAISKPIKSTNGTPISPAPPRTGMPSAMMGKMIARTIKEMIETRSKKPSRVLSLAEIGAACIASTGAHMTRGSAASITMFPIVPDYKKYPKFGRDLSLTTGEIGLAGHWLKKLLHYLFIYKAKAKLFWWMIPE